MIRVQSLIKSIRYASKGVRVVFQTEQNFRIQLIIGILVMAAAVFFEFPIWKIIILLLVVGSVLILELVNSIFERLVDAFKPRIHQYVAEMKDIMAATVLIASMGAVVIGALLFWPYLVNLFL